MDTRPRQQREVDIKGVTTAENSADIYTKLLLHMHNKRAWGPMDFLHYPDGEGDDRVYYIYNTPRDCFQAAQKVQRRTRTTSAHARAINDVLTQRQEIKDIALQELLLGTRQGGHATTSFLEGFLEGSLKEVLDRRVLRRCLVRVSVAAWGSYKGS